MARVYGSYSSGGSNRFRVGYEISAWSAVTSSSTTVTATFQFFVGNEFAVTNDQQTFDITFGESGAGTLTLGGLTSPYEVEITSTSSTNSPSTTERNIGPTRTVTYTYGSNEYGSSPGNFTGTITGRGSSEPLAKGFYTGGAATSSWTLAIPARPGGVPVVSSITASTNIGNALVSWSATADPPINNLQGYYDVFRNNDPGLRVHNSYTTSFTDSIGNGATAYYVIYAYNAAGVSAAVTSNTVTTPSLPSQPSSLTANTGTFGTIGLSWSASSGSGYTVTYTIARGGTTLGTTTSTSYNDTTVAPSTAYTYTVTPSTDVGSGTAASVSATSLGGVVRVWNGTSWVSIVPQVWNGTSWVSAQARVWNGTTWAYCS
jgi:hypothetical protein